jgi:hypothetical protein
VKERASLWSDEKKAEEVRALLAGELTPTMFSAEFVKTYRREWIAESE